MSNSATLNTFLLDENDDDQDVAFQQRGSHGPFPDITVVARREGNFILVLSRSSRSYITLRAPDDFNDAVLAAQQMAEGADYTDVVRPN